MDSWLIVVITISSGLAFFGAIFWYKSRKNRQNASSAQYTSTVMTTQVPQQQNQFPSQYLPPTIPQQPNYPPTYQQQPNYPQQMSNYPNQMPMPTYAPPPNLGNSMYPPQNHPAYQNPSNTVTALPYPPVNSSSEARRY